MPMSYLQSLPPPEEARDSAARVRERAGKLKDDVYARRCLALVETWYGDRAAARTLLDALVTDNAQSADTMHLSGVCDLRRAIETRDVELAKKARADFAAAHRIDGTRAHSLFRYAECELLEQGEPTAHMADVLVTAYNLAPQIDVIALVTGQVLMARDRFKEAELVLRPLLGELHAGERPRIAQQLVASAKAGSVPSFVFYGSAAGGMFPD